MKKLAGMVLVLSFLLYSGSEACGCCYNELYDDSSLDATEVLTSELECELCESKSNEKPSSGFLENMRDGVLNIMEKVQKRKKGLSIHRGKSTFRWFNPRIVRGDNYKTRLGWALSYLRDLSDEKKLTLYLDWAPLKPESGIPGATLDVIDMGLGFQQFINKKLYAELEYGVVRFVPNHEYAAWYNARGMRFTDEMEPYINVGMGYMLLESVLGLKRPLVFNLGYRLADDFKYPGTDPSGNYEIEMQGWHYGLSISFRF
jgi:hypothetical protein